MSKKKKKEHHMSEDKTTDIEVEVEAADLAERLRGWVEDGIDDEEYEGLAELLLEAAEALEERSNWIDLIPDADEVRLSEIQKVLQKWGWELELTLRPPL